MIFFPPPDLPTNIPSRIVATSSTRKEVKIKEKH